MWSIFRGAIVSLAVLSGACGALGADSSSSFGVLADIHFDPFEPKNLAKDLRSAAVGDWMARFAVADELPAAKRGSDTNYVLLASALSAVAEKMAGTDFVIVAGDLISHRFGSAVDETPDNSNGLPGDFAQKTATFVIDALRQALPRKPILVALGNNDSDCGDYAIEPDGDFLAATLETVRTAVGRDHLTRDFESTYRAGGYYEVRHPTVSNARILVLNDILWSRDYQNLCGSTGLDEARRQLEWLETQLMAQSARRGIVWIVHHIPWGIDAYSTLRSEAADCGAGIVPFLRDDVSTELLALLRRYSDTIAASFSAHSHFDDFRLILDGKGNPALADKMVPAISPIFGQDPEFLVFTYDVLRGTPLDYTSFHLANLDSLSNSASGDWRERYVFSTLYDRGVYSPESVRQLPKVLVERGVARELYYDRRTDVSREEDFSAYACAITNVEPEGFARCHCNSAP